MQDTYKNAAKSRLPMDRRTGWVGWRRLTIGGMALMLSGGLACAVNAASVPNAAPALAGAQRFGILPVVMITEPRDNGPVSSTSAPFGVAPPPSVASPKTEQARPAKPKVAEIRPTAPAAAPAAPPAPVPASVPVPAPVPAAAPVAVSAPAPAAAPQPEEPKATILLTLRGSNTIGLELTPKLAQAFLTFNGVTDVAVVRSKEDPDDATIVGNRAGKREGIFVSAHGSGFAAKGLLAHTPETPTDIGMASRRMLPAERDSLAAKGDMYTPGNEHVLALDGVAVVVNEANPLSALSAQQIKDIFSGAIADWGDKRLGGTPGPIHLYARDNNSGTYDTFAALVLRGAKLQADAKRFEDSEVLSASVAKDAGGIGFIGLPYVGSTKALAVSDAGTNPIRPNRLTVATEDYALARRLFLYTVPTGANTNPLVPQFVEFALSKSGQAIVDQVGFIGQTLQSEPVKTATGLPAEYVALVRNAERLSTDFRFKFNSTDLDNRGVRDTTRLADYLASRRIDPKRLVLIGFGDNVGNPAGIKTVSENRARRVAEELKRDGIAVGQIVGFGAAMPVADNASEDGRDKNRRVEVYVRS